MWTLRNTLALVVILLAINSSTTADAQSRENKLASAIEEPHDTSFEDALSHGVAASNGGRDAAAIEHFKAAVAFDPSSSVARLNLGTAYGRQVVPSLKTPENLATAENAIDNLKQIPQSSPNYLVARRRMASVYMDLNNLDDARDTELEILKLAPLDEEAHYTVADIDWRQVYRNSVTTLAAQGLQDDGIGNATLSVPACIDLRNKNSDRVQEGIDQLTRAIDLRPGYADAMAYLTLLYLRRAELACGDDVKRREDIAKADRWREKALIIRKQEEARTVPAKSR